MRRAHSRPAVATRAAALAQTIGLLVGAQALHVQAEPTGGPAEYAFRWSAAQDQSPRTIEAAVQLLGMNDKKPSMYRLEYAVLPRPTGLPEGVGVIARQRTELTGQDAGKVESSYKFRAPTALGKLAPEATFPCVLKSARWESELDVGWSSGPADAGPQIAAPARPPVITEVHSRTCSSAATLEAALSPPLKLLRPLIDRCAAAMTRYKDGPKNLKLEQWRMPGGETLLEVSRKVGKDTAQARLQFQSEVVGRLEAQGVLATRESKTELSNCP